MIKAAPLNGKEPKELTILRVKQGGSHTIPTKSPQWNYEVRALI